MNHRFVVLKTYVFQVNCPCSNGQHVEVKKGSILTITPEKKYVEGIGWYFLIEINHDYQIYISIYDFEDLYHDQKFCSLLDFDLKINYVEFKINQALDQKDSTAFSLYARELEEMNQLKNNILEVL